MPRFNVKAIKESSEVITVYADDEHDASEKALNIIFGLGRQARDPECFEITEAD